MCPGAAVGGQPVWDLLGFPHPGHQPPRSGVDPREAIPWGHMAAETWFNPVTLDKEPFCHLPCCVSQLGHRPHGGELLCCWAWVHQSLSKACRYGPGLLLAAWLLHGSEAHSHWARSLALPAPCVLACQPPGGSSVTLCFPEGSRELWKGTPWGPGVHAEGQESWLRKGGGVFHETLGPEPEEPSSTRLASENSLGGQVPRSWHAASILGPGCQLPLGLAKGASSWPLRL